MDITDIQNKFAALAEELIEQGVSIYGVQSGMCHAVAGLGASVTIDADDRDMHAFIKHGLEYTDHIGDMHDEYTEIEIAMAHGIVLEYTPEQWRPFMKEAAEVEYKDEPSWNGTSAMSYAYRLAVDNILQPLIGERDGHED